MLSEQFLRSVTLDREGVPDFKAYPYVIPAIRHLHTLALDSRITFFVGENGTGKSTLLEAIAVALGCNPEGGGPNFMFETRASHSPLYERIKLTRGVRRQRGTYFLRAESYFNLATNLESLPCGPLDAYGGVSPHEQSHGESFLALLTKRFGSQGLYILDEPEAALSPSRQLTVLSVLHGLIARRCQFIIATHSPILLAYPRALLGSYNKCNASEFGLSPFPSEPFVAAPSIMLEAARSRALAAERSGAHP